MMSIYIKATILIGVISFVLFAGNTIGASFQVTNLKCEYRENPIGIDVKHPMLLWQIMSPEKGWKQSAYEILVASNEKLLDQDIGDIWESGKVYSAESAHIIYAGNELRSKTRYCWKVRVWNGQGKVSAWSNKAIWVTGIFDPAEWGAKWISSRYVEAKQGYLQIPERAKQRIFLPLTPDTSALLMRKQMQINRQPVSATAYISGMGYYELYINGRKVGDHVLDPNFTDYTKRISYVGYDVLNHFKKGENVVGVILGNGWFNLPTPDLFQNEKACWKAAPKLLLNITLHFSDGKSQSIVSDGTWKWNTGEIVFNCVRGGETIDNRQKKHGWEKVGYDDSAWQEVVEVPAPFGMLSAQNMPPMRVLESVKPVKMWEPVKGVYVFDFGKNLTGWIKLKTLGYKGQVVTTLSNEKLKSDSTVNMEYSRSHTWGRFQTDIFILNGDKSKEIFEPRFTYHGFRYVQIEGLQSAPNLDDIIAQSVHTDLPLAGKFECSNPRLNHLQDAVKRTLLNCIHGIPGEEPTREKMGWTQDGQNTMDSYVYNFDASTSYIKYTRDLIDAQESNGHLPPIVPTAGWGHLQQGNNYGFFHTKANTIYCDDPWWGATLAIVANKLYEYYGDRRIIEESYLSMKKYVDFLSSTAKDNIVNWSLGDWCDKDHTWKGGPGLTSVEFTSSVGYFFLVNLLASNADLLGIKEDLERYSILSKNIKKSITLKFLDEKRGMYDRGSQTAQALALSVGIVPDGLKSKVESVLINDIINNNYHTTTGFIGVMFEMNYLAKNSMADIAYQMIIQENAPGWLYMVTDGTSTLGEQLYSRNDNFHHPFGACIGSWLYAHIAGILPDPVAPGFKQFILNPAIINGLDWASAEYNCLYGKIISEWEMGDERIIYNISIPANTSALVHIKTENVNKVRINGSSSSTTKSVEFIKIQDGKAVFRVGSGRYRFIALD